MSAIITFFLVCTAGITSAYGVYNNGGYNHPAYSRDYHHPHDWHRDHSRENKWNCPKIGTFNATNAEHKSFYSSPKIGYYTHMGKEKAIIVCDNEKEIQILVVQERGNTYWHDIFEDAAIISMSTKSGIVLECDQSDEKYTAYDFVSKKDVSVKRVACVTFPDNLLSKMKPFFKKMIN